MLLYRDQHSSSFQQSRSGGAQQVWQSKAHSCILIWSFTEHMGRRGTQSSSLLKAVGHCAPECWNASIGECVLTFTFKSNRLPSKEYIYTRVCRGGLSQTAPRCSFCPTGHEKTSFYTITYLYLSSIPHPSSFHPKQSVTFPFIPYLLLRPPPFSVCWCLHPLLSTAHGLITPLAPNSDHSIQPSPPSLSV